MEDTKNIEKPPEDTEPQVENSNDSKNEEDSKVVIEIDESPTPTTGSSNSSNSSPHLVSNSTLNPQEEELDTETKEKIKGDAIGNTLYSARFVLKTLMELKEQNGKNIDESFEKDLELLWDMTIEKDVVKMLLEYGVLEVFANIIDITEDERLIEILLGIIGNCCCLVDTREYLCGSNEIMAIILTQLSSSDPLILHQLMRLLHSAILFENSGDESIWFDHFRNCADLVEKFAFILSNSTSSTLLMSTFDALNAICAKFAIIEISESPKDSSFSQVFVKQILIDGLIEAFRQIIPPVVSTDSDQNMTDIIPTQNVQKFMNLFLELNLILSQYESVSMEAYRNLEEFKKCLARILLPLTQKEHLLPLSTNHQGVIENINDIFQALGDPFDSKCFAEMVVIWQIIEIERKSKEKKTASEWEDDDDEGTVIDIDDICMTILEFLTRTGFNCTQEEFVDAVKLLSPEIVKHLYERIRTDSEDEDEIRSVAEKLKMSLKTIWNVDDDVKA